MPSLAHGLSPVRRLAINRTNAGLSIIRHLGINFIELLIEIQTFWLKIICLKMSHATCWPFLLSLNVILSNESHGWFGSRFNIKMSYYQYRKSHCGDKTVVRSCYLHNMISYTGKKSSLYWIGALISALHLSLSRYNSKNIYQSCS